MTPKMYGASVVLAGAMVLAMSAAPGAQRGGRGGAAAGPAAVPVATNTILQNPDAYFGKPVTISAGVDQMLSKTAFLIDQYKASGPKDVQPIGKPILVIAPYLNGPLAKKSYLLMTGQIVKFDPTAIAGLAADNKLDLAPDVVAKYQGQPVLVATSVLSSTYAELARKPVPPPTAVEVSLSAVMKTIGPASAALRTAATDSKIDAVMQNVAMLKPAFTRTETIWDDLGQTAAAQWSRDARTLSAAVETSAAAGNWEAAKASAGALTTLCQNCHGVYRQPADDGTFRIKPGTF